MHSANFYLYNIIKKEDFVNKKQIGLVFMLI